MSPLLIATTNPGKIREISALLTGLDYQVIGLPELSVIPPPIAETGLTFTENAVIKSTYYFTQTGLLSLADDSGLEVDVLDGAPGIYSARFAGPEATDEDRVQQLLAALRDISEEQRTARFVCSLALTGYFEGALQTHVFEGIASGRIVDAPRGSGGFGYDPIFAELGEARTFAELTREEKSKRSHRGQALTAAKNFLTVQSLT